MLKTSERSWATCVPTLPPESVVRAVCRWLRLLRTSTVTQGWALLRADSAYTDLTQTQYADALDWLAMTGILQEEGGLSLPSALAALPGDQVHQLVFARALEAALPPWLPDADILVSDSSELPQDAASLAAELGVSDLDALSVILRVHGRLELEKRAAVGVAGELALIQLLEARWPGSTVHVALTDDGFGYDIAFLLEGVEWHLEVKSTTRRGRLVIYLSRHEHEVSLRDPHWRLVVLGLNGDQSPAAVATVDHAMLCQLAPMDAHPGSNWQSVRHQVSPAHLQPGLGFLDEYSVVDGLASHPLLSVGTEAGAAFAWMPTNRG